MCTVHNTIPEICMLIMLTYAPFLVYLIVYDLKYAEAISRKYWQSFLKKEIKDTNINININANVITNSDNNNSNMSSLNLKQSIEMSEIPEPPINKNNNHSNYNIKHTNIFNSESEQTNDFLAFRTDMPTPIIQPVTYSNNNPKKATKKENNFWIKYRRSLGNEAYLHKIVLFLCFLIIIYRVTNLITAVLSYVFL